MAKKRRFKKSFKKTRGSRASSRGSRPQVVRLEIIQSTPAMLPQGALQTGLMKPPPPRKAVF